MTVTTTEPVQTVIPVETARQADRRLCRSYLRAWLGSYGAFDAQNNPISFEDFQAAADRLAQV
jgi:hypothetical protein